MFGCKNYAQESYFKLYFKTFIKLKYNFIKSSSINGEIKIYRTELELK